ncbi:cytochrome P450 6B5-like [Microplitis mediator]|uniref:cytochrome P450 6B5-like n=1 Tax=Microplitis mediator TaxID=375433 RepID=UPI002554CCE8|nr:cytochrome P450 6B5-like [Microplitis mediator]
MFKIFLSIAIVVIIIVITLYYYLIKNYNYWRKRKVTGPSPQLIFGNTKKSSLLETTISECIKNIYDNYPDEPYVGIYELRTPVLLLRNPEIIKLVLIKDFSHFQGRGIAMNENSDPLSANLINLTGTKWRTLRTKLTPAFTSGKIKNMFEMFVDSSNKFRKFVVKFADAEETVEFRDLAAKFTTDIISTCCFGLETNTIQDNDSEFRSMCRKVLDPSLTIGLKRLVRWYLPGLFKYLQMSLTPIEVSNYFMNLVKNMIDYRIANNYHRNDILQLLMKLKDHKLSIDDNNNHDFDDKHSDIIIDDRTIAAQAYIFLLAGFETSSTTMSFTMFELAVNQEIQQKVYEEIIEKIKKYGKLSWDAIAEMEYLDCVIRETLRKHPPVGLVPRVCNEDYILPTTNLVIEKGVTVLIPIHAIHHDPKYYKNPEKFDPDRFFMDKNNNKHRDCVFLPFGAGPRICIGYRFAHAQTKAGIVALLIDYKVSLGKNMAPTLDYDPIANILTNKLGIWLKINWRNK